MKNIWIRCIRKNPNDIHHYLFFYRNENAKGIIGIYFQYGLIKYSEGFQEVQFNDPCETYLDRPLEDWEIVKFKLQGIL